MLHLKSRQLNEGLSLFSTIARRRHTRAAPSEQTEPVAV